MAAAASPLCLAEPQTMSRLKNHTSCREYFCCFLAQCFDNLHLNKQTLVQSCGYAKRAFAAYILCVITGEAAEMTTMRCNC